MPSSSARARARAGSRAPGRPAPRPTPGRGLPAAPCPLPVPYAAVFGLLVAAEYGYLAWLLVGTEPGWTRYSAVPLLLAGWAVAGAVLVWRGRGRGAVVLAAAAVPLLAAVVALAVLFGLLGGGRAMWSALLLLVGPVGCLALTLRRPVREWTRPVSSGVARRHRVRRAR